MTDLRGPGMCSQQEVSKPSAADSWCAPFPTSATRDPTAFTSWRRSLKGIMSPVSLSYTFSFSREGVRSTIKGVCFPVQINVPSTPDPVFSLAQIPSKGYVSLQGTLYYISPTLDLTLSGDWVQYPTRDLVFPVPESVAAIPFPVETSSGSDPAFYLAPFLSRTASFLFSILDPTLSKSPTRGSLRRCPENVTNDSSIAELSSGSGTSTGLFPPTRSISPLLPPDS